MTHFDLLERRWNALIPLLLLCSFSNAALVIVDLRTGHHALFALLSALSFAASTYSAGRGIYLRRKLRAVRGRVAAIQWRR